METLHSILDDAAATGNEAKLHVLVKRWERRAARWKSVKATHLADAVHWRGCAVVERLTGQIPDAMRHERMSDASVLAFGLRAE